MRIADLYIRVSTDEQADKGYSQRDQEERLRKYCEINNIRVRKVILEDHSAKTFKRPAWTGLLGDLRKRKGYTELVLFTKWDRFSRNAGDAYQMIGILRRLGVEPQAIEQPLDLSIPENKMMLAFYLAAPEVENDRRALNVFFGMRRAKKEGRWMGTAPVGYANKTNENGKKYIAPKEVQGDLMRWVFEKLSLNKFSTAQIWKEAKEKGLKCSKNNFFNAIRNPIYCGLIFIPKYKEEESMWVKGQHEPLISESLFYDVQDILDGRKRVLGTKITADESIPLRGFLICPKCGRMLTGSASKGRNKYYHYYHCSSACGVRFKAKAVNDKMLEEIKKYVLPHSRLELCKEVVSTAYQSKKRVERDDQNDLKLQLQEMNHRIAKARELLLCGDMDGDDYHTIKSECTEKINRLEAKLKASVTFQTTIKPLWDKAFNNIGQLDTLYNEGSIELKRKIVGSMFPENVVFDGFQHRTKRLNDVIRLISLIDNELKRKKNGTSRLNFDLSHKVEQKGIEPNQQFL